MAIAGLFRNIESYRGYEMGYDDRTGKLFVSKNLTDMRYTHIEVVSSSEGREYIDQLLDD